MIFYHLTFIQNEFNFNFKADEGLVTMSKYIIKGLLINKKGLFSIVNCFKTIFKANLERNILPVRVYSRVGPDIRPF